MSGGGEVPVRRLGSYELQEEIGRGGLGVVYQALHVHLRRLVAIKILHPTWTNSPEFVERFQEEGRVLAHLSHPNIIEVDDAGEANGLFYLAMHYCPGQSLDTLLKEPLPQSQALDIITQAGRALAYAHAQGVVHRDVKPANIIVGSTGTIKLTDFGLARLRDAPGRTMPGIRLGTPHYMAPERILGKPSGPPADLYSLGVILHEMIAGKPPFVGANSEEVFRGHVEREPPSLPAACPEWLQTAIRTALAKRPEDRYRDVETFLRVLECWGDPDALDAAGIMTPSTRAVTPKASVVDTHSVPGGPVKQDRTALALDVVGSARMKPVGRTVMVQNLFAQFRAYVRERLAAHSCLNSLWSGDGLLALFARPSQGAACAAAIMDGLAAFNAAHTSHSEPIRLRIGVHHGSVTMTDGQPLGEVISRTLDTAGHLQKVAPENSALVSESVFFSLPDNRRWAPAPGEYSLPFGFPVYQYTPVAEENAAEAAEGDVLRLEVVMGRLRKEYRIRNEALIGRPDTAAKRQPEIDLRQDDAVSRRHARLFRTENGFFLEDLESANGTTYNGRHLEPGQPVPLQPGDAIELGEITVLRVLEIGPGGSD